MNSKIFKIKFNKYIMIKKIIFQIIKLIMNDLS